MKKGINIWAFDNKKTIEESIILAKKAGFDGIELALDETGELSLNTDKANILRIKNIAEENNIEICSLATGLYWKYSITSENKKIREKAKDIVKKQLEIASMIGANAILVIPGIVGADFIKDCEIVSYDKVYEYSLEAFQELKRYAEDLKVNIALENVWNKFLLSPLEMRDFVDKIGNNYVGVYLDIGNVVYTGYPEQWVSILNKRIKKIHFKDFKRSIGNINGFVDLLSGDVNYPNVIRSLRQINYNDYVIAEVFPYKYFSEQIVYNTSNVMDTILHSND
ncbi:MAG: sugar phosphate isomerase/epimerase [Caloramator sp.]|nr:sugar phosphate isomerase/epimerase [Caloramator sp.]